jgi:hypothetical protein
MQTKLDLPYKEHLAFQERDNIQMSLPDTFGFDEYYTKLKSLTTNKSDLEAQKLEINCINSLNKIFETILNQTKSVREKLFIQDLYYHASRILKEDLSVFTKRAEVVNSFVKKKDKNCDDLYHSFAKQKFIQGKISKNTVDTINKSIKNLVEAFRNNAKNGKTTRDDLSVNNGSIVRDIRSLLNKEFANDCTLEILHSYMGVRLKVTGLAIELSVPNSNWWRVNHSVYDRQPSTTYFHFDESLAHPKAILYLSDVTERNGATSCAPSFVENSKMSKLQFLIGRAIICVGKDDNPVLHKYYNHKYHQVFGCPVFKNDFSRLPEELQFSSHFGWDVIPETPLENFLMKDEIKIIGEAGTYIAFDGGELPHRGGLLMEGERVALQIVFGIEKPFYKKVINKIKSVLKNKR